MTKVQLKIEQLQMVTVKIKMNINRHKLEFYAQIIQAFISYQLKSCTVDAVDE